MPRFARGDVRSPMADRSVTGHRSCYDTETGLRCFPSSLGYRESFCPEKRASAPEEKDARLHGRGFR